MNRLTALLLTVVLLALVGAGSLLLRENPAPPPTPAVAITGRPAPPATLERPSPTPPPTAPQSSPTAAPTAIPPTPSLQSEAERAELFDQVWAAVNANYIHPDFGGVDWVGIGERYRPQALAAPDADALYDVLEAMVAELNDDHSRFVRPTDADEEAQLAHGAETLVGIGILGQDRPGEVEVRYVFPGTPADEAGLARRDRITHVDGRPLTSGDQISGPEGSSVQLTVVSPGRPPRDIALKRAQIQGKISPQAQRLAADPTIGYLLIPSLWADDMDAQVGQALRTLLREERPLRGLVIDLRGNGGGWRHVLHGLLSHFVSGDVGSFSSQRKLYPLTIDPGELSQPLGQVPLAILIDDETQSYAEVFAAVLRQQRGAVIIGEPSAGNTETVFAYDFPEGSRLWVAQEGFALTDGGDLEGTGIVPDIPLPIDWLLYPLSSDPQLLRAVEELQARR